MVSETKTGYRDGGVTREEFLAMRESHGLTPVQMKMIEVLKDGRLHKPEHLRPCLSDEMAKGSAIFVHLSGLRKALRTRGMDISTVRIGTQSYYQMRSLELSSDE